MIKKQFEKSRSLLERARGVTPLGAQTYSKSYRYFSGSESPYFAERGFGGHIWDIDGNEYIDFILGLGAVTVGYNNPEVNEAIISQLEKGISFSQATELEVRLAEKLIEIIPCAEMVRFVKNGSDATTAAVRLARAATGREVVAVCGYHGMHDWSIGSTKHHRGIPDCVCQLSHSFEYNDIHSLENIFEKYNGMVAAVILEPVQGCGPENDFLQKTIELTHKNSALLIFDEVLSGFRIALGGAQEYYGVVPDMCAIGKGMANGMPISAVAGERGILSLIEEGVFISTTFGGETLSIAAALKTIEIFSRSGSYDRIWDLSTKLKYTLQEAAGRKGLDEAVYIQGIAPHSGFMFNDVGSLDHDDLLSVYQQTLLEDGILSNGINNFCLAHSTEDIERYIESNDAALDNVRRAIESDSIEGILKGSRINPIFKRN